MKKNILYFIFIFIGCQCIGQNIVKFDHLTTKQGLSENSVLCMLKDHLGYLWIGTAKGLVRYDGNEFKIFKHIEKDSTSLSANRILSLFEDRDGMLWVGVDGSIGLNSYDYRTEKFKVYGMDKGNPYYGLCNSVLDIYQSSDGMLWFGGWNGLRIYDKKKNKFLCHLQNEKNPKAITAKGVFKIIEDKNHKVWIFTFDSRTNVYRKETNDFERVSIETGGAYWKKVVKDKDENFYIICYGCGLIKFDPIKRQVVETLKPGNELACCYRSGFPTSDGRFWFGSDGGGVSIFDPATKNIKTIKNNANYPPSISENTLTDLYQDPDGLVWAGTWNRGLNIYDPNRYKFILYENIPGSSNPFSNKSILSLFEDSKKRLWVGTEGDGLWLYDKEMENFKQILCSENANFITSIAEDNYGNLLLGTIRQGLIVYNPDNKRIKIFANDSKSPNSLHGSSINKILKTKEGRILVAYNFSSNSFYSLQEFDDRKQEFSDRRLVDSLKSNAVTLYEDSKGVVWIGSLGQGVFSLDMKNGKVNQFIPVEKDNSRISNNEIVTIYEDRDHNMWFGSECCGLDCYHPNSKKWEHYNEATGLLSDIVHGILQDQSGNLWISTSKGLQKFDHQTHTFVNYEADDGLQTGAFNKNSSIIARGGRFFFGGTMGLNEFNPLTMSQSRRSPRINITSLLITNQEVLPHDEFGVLSKPISQSDTIVLSYQYKMFSLTYSAMVFSNQQHVNYAYKLEGFNKNWVQAGRERKVTYTNLDPGTYHFKVKATNNDGVWGLNEAKLTIIIVPPFWQTWWFRVLFISICILSSIRYYYYRVNLIKKRNKELEEIVSQRTYELKKANYALQEKNEEILQQKEEILAANESLEQQHTRLESAYNNMALVSDFGQKISSTLNFTNISEMIHEYVNNIVAIDSISIGVYMPEVDAIWWKYIHEDGLTHPAGYAPLSKVKDISTYCFTNKKTIFLPENADELLHYLSPEAFARYEGKTVICIPLIVENKVFGIFKIERNNLDEFPSKDISMLRSIAQYISFALDNAEAYEIVTHQNDQINGSIRYAKSIQQAILPKQELIEKYFETFILYQPKDIVSGDFYWFTELSHADIDYVFLAVVDCTGHGVPGAFMSMIGNRCLNEIVNEKHIIQPSVILGLLNEGIHSALRQKETENNDGMEISLCRFEKHDLSYRLCFASSKMKAFRYSAAEGRISVMKGDRYIIGGQQSIINTGEFTEQVYELSPGDGLYLTSDGIIDQNDDNRKRFGSSLLVSTLEANVAQPMCMQKDALAKVLNDYKRNTHQRDDITVIGIRI